ncbi:MAG: ABC transporter ATP-binding protein [Actinobacteria bacterium]|nr:MAG: ABC transporter ATP-binding protein [Actinomycetota bacterium]
MAAKTPKRASLSPRELIATLQLRYREIATLLFLIILMGLFEGLGISMLLPVLQYIDGGAEALSSTGGIFGGIMSVAEKIGVPINLVSLLLMAFVPILLRGAVFFVNSWYAAVLQRRMSLTMRVDGFAAVTHGDLSFVVEEGQGNIVSILTQQIYRGSTALLQFVQMSGGFVLIAIYLAILLAMSPLLAGITLVAVGAISIVIRGNVRRSREAGLVVSQSGNETFAQISERVSAIRLIKMRGQEDAETEHIRTVSTVFEQAQVKIQLSRAAVEITVDPALMLAVFVIIYVGVEYLHASLASLGLFMFILLRLNQQSKNFNIARQQFSANIDGLKMVMDTINRAKESRTVLGGSIPYPGLREGITLRDVTFRYDDAESEQDVVLDHVSVEIPKGSMVAFVGRSGAGKSTLVDLLPHLRDVSGGSISFDGVDVREFDLRSLRRRVGFMTQDAMLFNDTLRNNIVYGLEREATDDEIQAALAQAYCGFVNELPDGLDTVAGDRGVRLSGGQRQRIALARVFLEDPDILILDEPTSALDSESELYISKALDEFHKTRTLIVIAHRLSTVQRADRIYVLDQGHVVEQGTHDELLAAGGAYHRLFELQTAL